MTQIYARIVGGDKLGMATKELMGLRVDCTGVFKIYVWVSSLEVAIVGSSLVDGPSCSSLSDGVVSCCISSSLGIKQW